MRTLETKNRSRIWENNVCSSTLMIESLFLPLRRLPMFAVLAYLSLLETPTTIAAIVQQSVSSSFPNYDDPITASPPLIPPNTATGSSTNNTNDDTLQLRHSISLISNAQLVSYNNMILEEYTAPPTISPSDCSSTDENVADSSESTYCYM